jgi:hypothetical protein
MMLFKFQWYLLGCALMVASSVWAQEPQFVPAQTMPYFRQDAPNINVPTGTLGTALDPTAYQALIEYYGEQVGPPPSTIVDPALPASPREIIFEADAPTQLNSTQTFQFKQVKSEQATSLSTLQSMQTINALKNSLQKDKSP